MSFALNGVDRDRFLSHVKTRPSTYRDWAKETLGKEDTLFSPYLSVPFQMAREAGANRVYFASAAPPVQYPNVYGIDMPAADELIGHNRTAEEIAELIGADWLIYQDLEDLVEAVRKKAKCKIDRFDTSVFNGDYVTGDVTAEYLKGVEMQRNDNARSKDVQGSDAEVVELYNSG